MAQIKLGWRVYTFKNNTFGEVRAIQKDNEPYFVGRDVATALGYARPQNALRSHVDDEDTFKQRIPDNYGVEQETLLINESGLYSLILSSKLPTAKAFKRWVTSEVLPSIRKTGQFRATAQNTPSDYETERLKADQELANIDKAKTLLTLARTAKAPYRDLLKAYATKYLTGEFLLPVPDVKEIQLIGDSTDAI